MEELQIAITLVSRLESRHWKSVCALISHSYFIPLVLRSTLIKILYEIRKLQINIAFNCYSCNLTRYFPVRSTQCADNFIQVFGRGNNKKS